MPSTKNAAAKKPRRRPRTWEPTPIWDREFATRYAKITGSPVVKTGRLPA